MATLSQEETLALINTKAKENGDSFLVKVFRKRHSTGLPESVATFGDAQAIHIVSPETWLPRISGGGPIYLLQSYHSTAPSETVGSPIQVSVPTDNLPPKTPGEIDPRVVKSGSWTGPRVLIWPSVEDKKTEQAPAYLVPSTLPQASSPVASTSQTFAPATFDKAAFDRNLAMQQQLDQERASFLRMKEELAEDQRRQREELAESRRAAEIDSLKRENDARVREMQAEMRTLVAAQSQAPKTDIAQTIAAVTTAATPILVQMLAAQNEMRLAMMKQQDAVAAAAAESNRQLMTAMLAKPAVDPVMERLFSELKATIEKANAQQTPQSTMLHSMAETTASMTQTMMELVQSAADMNLGGGKQEDHPALKAVREGVKAVQSLFAGYQTATMNKMGLQPGMHPGHPGPNGNGMIPNGQYAYPQPHQLPPPVQVQPQAAPVVAPASVTQTVQVPAPGFPQAKTVVEHLENMFKVQSPPEEIAKVFVHALQTGDKDLAAALDDVGGVMEELFKKRLGAFIMANPQYIEYGNSVISAINFLGEKEGIFEDEADEDEEEQFTEEDAA